MHRTENGSPQAFNSIVVREDLSVHGQVIAEYTVDYFDSDSKAWVAFPKQKGDWPSIERDTCSTAMGGINLVNSARDLVLLGTVDNAQDCAALCHKNSSCNFVTWFVAIHSATACTVLSSAVSI